MDLRQVELTRWAAEKMNVPAVELSVVSGDASFRRYFRFELEGQCWIAMDAPPEQEDSHSFVAIAEYWRSNNICTPEVFEVDFSLGFLLLSDFGDQLLLSKLNPENPTQAEGDFYYRLAMDSLLKIQNLAPDPNYALPDYDDVLLHREMALFRDWLLEKKLGLELTAKEHALLDGCFNALADNAMAQTQVPVHRDFHARNLMVLSDDSSDLGVLDFQDAVLGPVTYDLVSLLRDCYIVWPDQVVEHWCRQYHALVKSKGIIHCNFEQFKNWFDLMGMQRHLKAAGIFARLSLRDGKHAYLEDIPRTVDYICRVGRGYKSMQALVEWLEHKVIPLLADLGRTP